MIEVKDGRMEVLKPDGTKLTSEEKREKCLEFLKMPLNQEERLNLQRALIQITAEINPDEVEGLFGIRIVERKEERPKGEGCFSYTVGEGIDVQKFHDNMFANYKKSETPIAGAYALYLKFGFVPCHIGRVTEKGTIISKWGPKAHVYEHQPELAPISYGEVIYYSP